MVSNQPLSLFYGFHPVNLLPALFLLFFLFRERRQYAAAGAVMLLTLFVQETAAIFWFGCALYLAAGKQYRKAALLAGGMLLFFFLTIKFAIPAAVKTPGGTYTQMFHFSQLGSTPGEVLLPRCCAPPRSGGRSLLRTISLSS